MPETSSPFGYRSRCIAAGLLLTVSVLLLSAAVRAQAPATDDLKRTTQELRRQLVDELRHRPPRPQDNERRRLGHELLVLQREFDASRQSSKPPGPQQMFRSGNSMLRVNEDRVFVDVIAEQDAQALREALEALGMQHTAVFGRHVSGALPIDRLDTLDRLATVRHARAAMAGVRSGLVTSQGDIAQYSDDARAGFDLDGSGVTVGSLSDSYDCLDGAAADIASFDLPAGIVVLADEAGCSSGSDEGRAMMQIVHDIAPGADQAFHSAFNGMADFANGILELHSIAGADIITDDVFYFAEPFFQDGVVAQAADTVMAQGVAYFSSAGNQADDAYLSAFEDSGQSGFRSGSTAHDFDPGPGTDTRQSLTIPANAEIIVVMQWAQPFFSVSGAPGSASDLDIVLYPGAGGPALAGGIDNNLGGDAVEIFVYTNISNSPQNVNLGIDLVSGPLPDSLMVMIYGNPSMNEFATHSPTIVGHANAAGARAVGAVRYSHAPAYGVSPPLRESFSSVGAVPILFDQDGMPVMELRQKPEIMAPNGGDNTFFGSDYEANGFPNFFGTSAAAPHAAGVAALLKEYDPAATPQRLYAALQATAIDMDAPGVDSNSGYGLINAEQAAAALTPLILDIDWAPQAATKGQFYWWEGLSVSGGLPPYTWSIAGGWLPWPLTLNQAGVISGTPNNPATANFTVEVTDALSTSATVATQIVISSNAYVCGACHQAASY